MNKRIVNKTKVYVFDWKKHKMRECKTVKTASDLIGINPQAVRTLLRREDRYLAKDRYTIMPMYAKVDNITLVNKPKLTYPSTNKIVSFACVYDMLTGSVLEFENVTELAKHTKTKYGVSYSKVMDAIRSDYTKALSGTNIQVARCRATNSWVHFHDHRLTTSGKRAFVYAYDGRVFSALGTLSVESLAKVCAKLNRKVSESVVNKAITKLNKSPTYTLYDNATTKVAAKCKQIMLVTSNSSNGRINPKVRKVVKELYEYQVELEKGNKPYLPANLDLLYLSTKPPKLTKPK